MIRTKVTDRITLNNYYKVIALAVICLTITASVSAQKIIPLSPDLNPGSRSIYSSSDEIIPSNSIIDLEIFNDYLWVASGRGLGRFLPGVDPQDPAAGSWKNAYGLDDGFGNGGVSGLAVGNASFGGPIVWAATAIDTLISGEDYAAGGGVGYSLDEGESWYWMPQPVDPRDVEDFEPTTVSVNNVTYDIAILRDRVWIASFAGGLRYLDMTPDNLSYGPDSLEWVNRPPDTLSFDVVDNLNHRVFSVAAMDTLLWVGTAGGVNLSRDNGDSWQRFSHSSSNEATISGNFIPALGVQQTSSGQSIIWAATWAAEGASEFYGISRSFNNGLTWERVMGSKEEPIRVHNFAFDDSVVYAVSDDGLFKSPDYGQTWGVFPPIIDSLTKEAAYGSGYFSAAVGLDRLWVGGPEGLAVSYDKGNNWRLMRTFEPPGKEGNPSTYAYPNPFSPKRFGVVRLQYNMKKSGQVTVEVYDFAMELVARPVDGESRPAGDWNEVWNGKGPGGEEVANGVYFYRIDGGGEERWGKILVLD